MLGAFAPRALAANLTVVFENNPLFGEVNFLPGDTEEGNVEVNNGSGTEQDVYAESVNGFDPDGLGSRMRLQVFENANPVAVYDDDFDNFLSAGHVLLSALGAGATTTYTFEVSFIDSADNNYQGKSLGFDLCIGFSGGAFQCGDTVIGDEEDTGGGDNNDGGDQIPGTGGGPVTLAIFDEQTIGVNPVDGSAVITWDTNLLSTSQVIYGLASGGPYTLDVDEPIIPLGSFFGYPLGTLEDPIKVTNHSVSIAGLTPGQTYLYRVVSRASPPTVSVERTFIVPTIGAGNSGISLSGPIGSASGEASIGEGVGDAVATSSGAEATSTEEVEDNGNLLAFALGGLNFDLPGLICVGVALLIFLILLWLIWLIFKNKKDQSLSRDVALLVTFGLIVSFILWLIPYTCPIIPLWVIIAIYVIWQLFTRKN